jgi:hypothetical protein
MLRVRRVEEKRRNALTLPARLGRRDQANWHSPAPSGRNGLCAHWFLHLSMESGRHGAGARLAAENFPFLISIFQAMALTTCVNEKHRCFFAMMRVHAI